MTDEEFLRLRGWKFTPMRDGKHWMNKRCGAGHYDTQAALKIQRNMEREARIATKTGQG
jgi:hypothetical protein